MNLFSSIRYGKRTTQGILNDLWNALARYYLNNFADGTKQVVCSLFMLFLAQGKYLQHEKTLICRPG
jgi:hypothetical protein